MIAKKLIAAIIVTSLFLGAVIRGHAEDLVMGLIPAESNEEMIKTFEPMRAHLEKNSGEKSLCLLPLTTRG